MTLLCLLSLPRDLLCDALTYLSLHGIAQAAATSAEVRDSAYHDHVWRSLALPLLTTVPLSSPQQTLREYYCFYCQNPSSWRYGTAANPPRSLVTWCPGPAQARDTGVVVPNNPSLHNSSFTVEFWLQQTSFNVHNIVCQHTDWDELGWSLYFRNGSHLHFMVGDGYKTNQDVSMNMSMSNFALPWVHIAATYDGMNKQLKLYKNGYLESEKSLTDKNESVLKYPPRQHLMIGAGIRDNLKYALCGRIAEWRMWNVCRTENDIQKYYMKYISSNQSSLIMYYRFQTKLDNNVERINVKENQLASDKIPSGIDAFDLTPNCLDGKIWASSKFMTLTKTCEVEGALVQDKRSLGELYEEDMDESKANNSTTNLDHPVKVINENDNEMVLAISTQSLGNLSGKSFISCIKFEFYWWER